MSGLRNRGKVQEPKVIEVERSSVVEKEDDEKFRLSFFDVIRMLSGFILLNLMISYFFTGSLAYGYNGKLIDPHYLYFQAFGTYVNLTDSELAQYDGSIDGLPIYIAVNGTVFDVSSQKGIYGPGGSYSYLSGKDCARAFATNCLNQQTYDIRDIEPDEKRRLRGWFEFFENKYFKVGIVTHEPFDGPIPDYRSNCRGRGQ